MKKEQLFGMNIVRLETWCLWWDYKLKVSNYDYNVIDSLFLEYTKLSDVINVQGFVWLENTKPIWKW